MQKLIVKGVLPGLNEMTQANRSNIYVGSRQKKAVTNLVALSCKASKLKKIEGYNNYFFTWYCKDKRRDKDNIMAGQKYIFDGLQAAGIIENDGRQQVGDITHRFEIDKINPRVEVVIAEGDYDEL